MWQENALEASSKEPSQDAAPEEAAMASDELAEKVVQLEEDGLSSSQARVLLPSVLMTFQRGLITLASKHRQVL